MDRPSRRPVTRLLAGALILSGVLAAGYLGWRAAFRLTPEDSRRIMEEADQDLMAGRLGPAERKFGRVAASDPADARAAFGLGLALSRQGRHREALASIERAALLEPGNTDHAYVRAHTLALLGRREDAVAAFESILKVDPDRQAAAAEMIGILIDSGRWEEARRAAGEAIARAPAAYALRILAGRIEGHLGSHDAAIEHYRQARQIRSYSPQPVYGLIEEYRRLGRLDESRALVPIFEDLKSRAESVEKLRLDAAADPSDPGPSARYVGRLLDEGRLDEGVEQMGLFVAQFPDSPARRSLALRGASAAVQIGDTATARRFLQAAEEGPLGEEESLAAADAHAGLGDQERARALYQARLASAPQDARALTGLARLSLGSGDLVRAEDEVRQALEAAPDRADAHALLGLVLLQLGNTSAGEARLGKALEVDPAQADALFGLGFLAQQRRENAKSEGYLKRALERRPEFTQARVVLALSLSDQGRCEEAIPLFTRALGIDYSNLTLHAGLVRCLELTGRTAEAERARGIAEKLVGRTPAPTP
ncbi:MAG TPA: tetratricopeptide repeat protein [Candidatus Polarisedimenticolia bacterium]|jgi:tetratricopeptide (TPR) repeat protein